MNRQIVFKNKSELIGKLIHKSDVVLDVGFWGQGVKNQDPNWPHRLIQQSAADVYGLDFDLTDDFIANSKIGHYFRMNAENFSLPLKVDVIFAGDLLEHLSNPGLFLSACRKSLKDGGRLIMTTPNCFNLFNLTEKVSKVEPTVNRDHTCYFNLKTLRQLLEKNDCRIVEWGYVYSLEVRFQESFKKIILNFVYRLLYILTDKYLETIFVVVKF